jgi:hypothetical protein
MSKYTLILNKLISNKYTTNQYICLVPAVAFLFLGGFFYPIFTLYHALLYTNLHIKFQKNPSVFPECRPNTNLLRFHASWNVKISFIAKFQLKIPRGPEKNMSYFHSLL